jgi:hypothetical protein
MILFFRRIAKLKDIYISRRGCGHRGLGAKGIAYAGW